MLQFARYSSVVEWAILASLAVSGSFMTFRILSEQPQQSVHEMVVGIRSIAGGFYK